LRHFVQTMDETEASEMKIHHAAGCGVASLFLTIAATATALAADAPHISVSVENGSPNMRTTAHYDCAGQAMEIDYINVEPNFLAVVPVQGKERIFVLVMSGSGALYASGPYIWWSKGKEASLYDATKGENAPPVLTCTE
jgi:membrane-bound inhibitor of C-type lysozyme